MRSFIINRLALFRLAKWQLALVFVVCLLVFWYLQPPQVLADPDSWYHVRLTTLMRDYGLVRDFPWTQASLYRDIFIDHHLLYHVLLLPFVGLASHDLAGGQLATVIFASLSTMTVLWCLWRWRAPYWAAAALLLLTSAPFLFRLSLLKAPSLAVGVAVVAYYLVTSRKLGWIFWWSWFYVWFYSAWPLMVIVATLFVLVDSLSKIQEGWRVVVKRLINSNNLKLLLAVVTGAAAGLVTNPYFPVNLRYLQQIFSMALKPYHTFIGIGGEWYPMNLFDLLKDLSYPLLVWLLAILTAVFTFKRQSSLSRTTWLLALIFLFYTLRARRQTEYLVPWLVMSSWLIMRDAGVGNVTWAYLKEKFASWIPNYFKKKYVATILIIYAIVVVPWGLSYGFRLTRASLAQGYEFNTLSGAATWLRRHSPPRAVVFQSDWGTFPMLFYHNSYNYYLTGLDQTFMYEYDRAKYQQWLSVTQGETSRIYQIAREVFGASYLLLEKRTPAMLVWLNRDPRFTKVYEDAEAIVYSLQAN